MGRNKHEARPDFSVNVAVVSSGEAVLYGRAASLAGNEKDTEQDIFLR